MEREYVNTAATANSGVTESVSAAPIRAVVLLSGGLDSATVLAMARAEGRICHAVSFDYGQRHRAELLAAARLAVALGAVEHRVMKIDTGGLGGSALSDGCGYRCVCRATGGRYSGHLCAGPQHSIPGARARYG